MGGVAESTRKRTESKIISMVGSHIWVKGVVQGVGFRPFVYTLASQLQLTGWVRNTSRGVEIEVNGSDEAVKDFIEQLRTQAPPLARLDSVEVEASIPNDYTTFDIIESQPLPGEFIPISPDVAICPDCQRELFDPTNRRFRHPFISCTNCGPRFTIITDIPYDRPKTSMANFPMCPQCEAEYHNPLDRRFHAQPVACPNCGPAIWFESGGVVAANGESAIQLTRQKLREGKIVAIKGLGGFHLACDALNTTAVANLRHRKRRSLKPFALMAFDLQTVQRHCLVNQAEQELLTSRQKPVVLLKSRPESAVSPEVAPAQARQGVMLAYTPLHLLLLEPAPDFPELLVMTSANLSEEPIAYQDNEARQRLSDLADGFLMHNRPIHTRIDDSVLRVVNHQPYFLRRARGYAPDAISLPFEMPPVLATGAELKNTFCLTRQKYAFISHHIGDLENFEILRSFEEGIQHYERLFYIRPELLAADLHPDYLSTRYAQQRASEQSLPLLQVQHHHAHLAACLADNQWNSKDAVIGLIFDGTGFGSDGAIWGGEVLLGGYTTFERAYHLDYVPLPGGDAAVRNPGRMALAYLKHAGIDWNAGLPPVTGYSQTELSLIQSQIEKRINSPLTSSMGRLFDAVSALLGICQHISYEGQAAIELEALSDANEDGFYPINLQSETIDVRSLWESLVIEYSKGIPTPLLAARFHNSIARLGLQVCENLRRQTGIDRVALSGGVWQNIFLLNRTVSLLHSHSFKPLIHRRVPANDGGVALGQAVIASFYQ